MANLSHKLQTLKIFTLRSPRPRNLNPEAGTNFVQCVLEAVRALPRVWFWIGVLCSSSVRFKECSTLIASQTR